MAAALGGVAGTVVAAGISDAQHLAALQLQSHQSSPAVHAAAADPAGRPDLWNVELLAAAAAGDVYGVCGQRHLDPYRRNPAAARPARAAPAGSGAPHWLKKAR